MAACVKCRRYYTNGLAENGVCRKCFEYEYFVNAIQSHAGLTEMFLGGEYRIALSLVSGKWEVDDPVSMFRVAMRCAQCRKEVVFEGRPSEAMRLLRDNYFCLYCIMRARLKYK